MADYKHTLNLPKTDFPMKANLSQREPSMLKAWQADKIYEQLREQRQGAQRYILHDGPPYANGELHLGHAFNKIIKDFVVKSQSLNGFDAPFVPGWDCHGLPIELNVEKKVGKAGHKISAAEFRQACRSYASKQVDQQRESFKRLGVLGDWAHPYITMDSRFEANIIRTLAKIVDQGHLSKGYKPIHWCLDCRSALAEAEVEYQDKSSPAIDVGFKLIDSESLQKCFNTTSDSLKDAQVFIPIWTTTPWTIPANQAVAAHPTLEYALVKSQSAASAVYYVVAKNLSEAAMQRFDTGAYDIVGECLGQVLQGLELQHPLYERTVPLVMGEHVTVEAGTGFVHTAPAHGLDDYYLALQYDLPMDDPVGPNGCYNAHVPLFAGQHVFKANDLVIEALKAQGTLLVCEPYKHSYPHCWRHKSPLIYRATQQWFVSMEAAGLREKALAEIKKVQWSPSWGEARITTMVEQRPDWCISRQRSWGVPLPLFVHKDTGDAHPETSKLMAKVAELVEVGGLEAWFDLDPQTLLGSDAAHYDKLTDTLDVWFDSGATYFSVLQENPNLAYPANLYLEGSDQHRGWFQTSLLSAVATTGQAPYKQVLTHGYTVDAQGRKMSKSLGNTVSPKQVIDKLGADILRLWVSSLDYRAELSYSDEIIKRVSDAYRRMRNTIRFLLSNLAGFEPSKHALPADQLLPLDLWAVDRARRLQTEIKTAYDQYQFTVAYQSIYHFCSQDMGSFYLDVIKDRQYTTQENSLARRSVQTALWHIAQGLLRWLAPILSFTAEEAWAHLPGTAHSSVLLATWYDAYPVLDEHAPMGVTFWQTLMRVRDEVNKGLEAARNAGQLGSGLEAEVAIYCDAELYTQLNLLQDELRFVLITSKATVHPLAEKGAASETGMPGLYLEIQASSAPKCTRCWHRRDDVGAEAEHPELCGRCVVNVSGAGEYRAFA